MIIWKDMTTIDPPRNGTEILICYWSGRDWYYDIVLWDKVEWLSSNACYSDDQIDRWTLINPPERIPYGD